MKAFIFTLIAIVIFGGAVQTDAQTEETVTVALGKRTTADRGRLKIKFLEIVEDSRCPRDATCIWAGNAKIRISISRGTSSPKIIELNTLTEPRNHKLYGYEFELRDLHPQKGDTGPFTAVISVVRR